MSYAALLPKEITDLMPALRSAWFSLHIGAAVFSYSFFLIAAALAIKYIISIRKGAQKDDPMLIQTDTLSYRLTASGFMLLTVVILSGCIWAEQAWSTFWSWDPKETWALITWLLYALYLHLRINKKWKGTRIAWFSIIAIICVVFSFVGVNQILPSLHTYK
jgi:cytochrome c-type biogenesis protein CcsB